MSNGSTSDFTMTLDLQTGMPQIYPSRSKELLYDSLMDLPTFILNPFGPQQLNLSRPNHHW
jgi:hypothetical protein